LRLLEEESMKENTRRVTVQLPVDVATFLLNEKRAQLILIEDRHNLHILIVPNEHLETPQYIIERTRTGEDVSSNASYEIKEISQPDYSLNDEDAKQQLPKEEPAVKSIQQTAPPKVEPVAVAPEVTTVKAEEKPGLFSRVWSSLFGKTEEPEEPKRATRTNPRRNNNRNRNRNERDDSRGRNRNRNERDDTRNKRRRPPEATEGNEAQPTSEQQKKPNRRPNRDNRNRNKDREKPEQVIEETSTNEVATDTAANDQPKARKGNKSEKPEGRHRSRYNSRNYNSRRRAPANAATLSIDSPAPGSERSDNTAAMKSAENVKTPAVETVVEKTIEVAPVQAEVKDVVAETSTPEVQPTETNATESNATETAAEAPSTTQAEVPVAAPIVEAPTETKAKKVAPTKTQKTADVEVVTETETAKETKVATDDAPEATEAAPEKKSRPRRPRRPRGPRKPRAPEDKAQKDAADTSAPKAEVNGNVAEKAPKES
jgi:ribonuclease E